MLGDVKADGRTDFAVGDSENAWVFFGSTDHAPIDVRALGERGFEIGGGRDVGAAGDVKATGGRTSSPSRPTARAAHLPRR